MKRLLLTFCICMATIVGVSAQEKGDMAVGLNLGVAPCLESGASCTNFGIGAKFQYNVTTPIRLEADLDYWFKAKGIDVFDVSANVHYLFSLSEKLKLYPLVGIGYAHLGGGVSVDFDDEAMKELGDLLGSIDKSYGDEYNDALEEANGSTSANKFLFNVGIGAQFALNDRLSVGAEIKYQYIKDFSRLPINIGVTYKF